MSSSSKTTWRPLAILKLPEYEVPRFITYARSIVRAMTNNPSFPSPVPPLATIEAAIDALAEAETARLARTAGTVPVRNAKRKQVKQLLEQLCSYVQVTADATEQPLSIIESAGMSVKRKGGPPPPVFGAKPGQNSGSVILVAPKAGNRAAYEWQMSTDGGKTWVTLEVTVKATTTVHGLTPGSTVSFRYRTVTKNGTGDWSEPVSIIVQ